MPDIIHLDSVRSEKPAKEIDFDVLVLAIVELRKLPQAEQNLLLALEWPSHYIEVEVGENEKSIFISDGPLGDAIASGKLPTLEGMVQHYNLNILRIENKPL